MKGCPSKSQGTDSKQRIQRENKNGRWRKIEFTGWSRHSHELKNVNTCIVLAYFHASSIRSSAQAFSKFVATTEGYLLWTGPKQTSLRVKENFILCQQTFILQPSGPKGKKESFYIQCAPQRMVDKQEPFVLGTSRICLIFRWFPFSESSFNSQHFDARGDLLG